MGKWYALVSEIYVVKHVEAPENIPLLLKSLQESDLSLSFSETDDCKNSSSHPGKAQEQLACKKKPTHWDAKHYYV